MVYELTKEQKMIQGMAREFAVKDVSEGVAERYAKHEFPIEIVKKLGEIGIMGLTIDAEYGGSGGDEISFCLAILELTKIDPSLGVTVFAHVALGARPIEDFGTEKQKREWLTPLAKGEKLGAMAITEPGGGSDVAAMTTSAVTDGDEWVINGSKTFITNPGTPMSMGVNLACVTGEDKGKKEYSVIFVPTGTPGYVIGNPLDKVGFCASDTRELSFDDCRVPKENLIGPEGKSFKAIMNTFNRARICASAFALGIGEGAFQLALKYAKERKAFGKAIGEFQHIAFRLADMEIQIELVKNMIMKAAWLCDNGKDFIKEATISRVSSGDVAIECTQKSAQIFGGYGFMNEYPISRFNRDGRSGQIGEGTGDVMKIILARMMGFPGM